MDTAAHWDGLCPLCLKERVERLEEIIREEKPDTWSFDTLLYVGRRLLRDVYPADIFTGVSGDSGPQYVVALRAAIDRIDLDDKINGTVG